MAGPYIERLPQYDLVYGFEYNRIVDALTNNRPQGTVAMLNVYDVCFGYQPVDATFKARCRFHVHTNVDTIILVSLHFTLQPFHVGNQTTSAGTTTTAGSVTSAGGSAHSHSVSGQSTSSTTSNNSSGHAHFWSGSNIASSAANNPVHYDGVNQILTAPGGGGGLVFATSGEQSLHNHPVPSTSVTGATSTSESTHTHSVPGQTVTIPSLNLNPPTAIYEAGMAQGVHVFIDGVDRTSALGGPWGSGSALDITDLNCTSFITTTGWHEFQLSSTAIGGITTQVQFSGLINGSIA